MCAVREQNKCRITPAEMEFMRTAKYTWKFYKPGEDILSELKLNPVVKKCKIAEINEYMFGKWTETDCHT